MKKYWILIAAKNQVVNGVVAGYAEACHGKSNPLRRMQVGDGIICYSPKLDYGEKNPYQRFTALGCVTGKEIYKAEDSKTFAPYRREIKYVFSRETSIKPLINQLTFIEDKTRWGSLFRYGVIRIPAEDFMLIAKTMNVSAR